MTRWTSAALAGLTAAATILLTAGPASAATTMSITDSSGHSVAGDTLTADTVVTATATGTGLSRKYTLTVTAPDGTTKSDSDTATLNHDATMSVSVDTTNFEGGEAPNGTYTFDVNGGNRQTVTLAIPPRQVTGVQASADSGSVTLTWQANSEPDLVDYVVSTSDGATATVTPSQAGCAVDATCADTMAVPSSDAGRTITFSVAAQRCSAPGSGCSAGNLITGQPGTAQAGIPAAPSPSPSGGGTGGGGGAGSGGGTGGGSTGGSTSPGQGGHNGVTSSGKLKAYRPNVHTHLPTAHLPAYRSGPVLPGGEGLGATGDQGGYKPTLAYPSRPGQASRPAAGGSVISTISSALDIPALWRSLGLAAVLLLAAVHLLLWLRHTEN